MAWTLLLTFYSTNQPTNQPYHLLQCVIILGLLYSQQCLAYGRNPPQTLSPTPSLPLPTPPIPTSYLQPRPWSDPRSAALMDLFQIKRQQQRPPTSPIQRQHLAPLRCR